MNCNYLRQAWSSSSLFRILLAAALLYSALRLTIHIVYISGLLLPPGQTSADLPIDLETYMTAAQRLPNRENLYPPAGQPLEIVFYQYSPPYAALFSPLVLWFTPQTIALLLTALHILAYGLFYLYWCRLFQKWNLQSTAVLMSWSLPLWLVYASFWSDLTVLNVRVFLALLVTLLVDAIWEQHLGRASLWLVLILLAKPQWAFAIALPLLLGRYRFFMKLVAAVVVGYGAVTAVTIVAFGPQYGLQQYRDYYSLLLNMVSHFPWRGPASRYLGDNHSIKQIVVFLAGVSSQALTVATLIKTAVLAPLAFIVVRTLLRPARFLAQKVVHYLNLAFVLYLGAYIWLDIIWGPDLFLGIVILLYLSGTLFAGRQYLHAAVWALFGLYALTDFFDVIGYLVWGTNIVIPGQERLLTFTNPNTYFPLAMLLILAFYIPLVYRLWQRSGVLGETAVLETKGTPSRPETGDLASMD